MLTTYEKLLIRFMAVETISEQSATMTFERLLRGSRIVSLHKPEIDLSSQKTLMLLSQKPQPVYQIVGTTSSSFHRRNWGLKSMIPSKHKSLNLNIQALDSETGLAQYDGNTGFYRKLQRFREFGQPLENRGVASGTPFLNASTEMDRAPMKVFRKRLADMKKSGDHNYAKFDEYLATKGSKRSEIENTKGSLNDILVEYLGQKPGKVQPTSVLGINYSLMGSLDITPSGIRKNRVVKARESGKGKLLVGGFVGVCDRIPPVTAERFPVRNVIVSKTKPASNGGVEVTVRTLASHRDDKSSDSVLRSLREASAF